MCRDAFAPHADYAGFFYHRRQLLVRIAVKIAVAFYDLGSSSFKSDSITIDSTGLPVLGCVLE